LELAFQEPFRGQAGNQCPDEPNLLPEAAAPRRRVLGVEIGAREIRAIGVGLLGWHAAYGGFSVPGPLRPPCGTLLGGGHGRRMPASTLTGKVR